MFEKKSSGGFKTFVQNTLEKDDWRKASKCGFKNEINELLWITFAVVACPKSFLPAEFQIYV
jgi:hypothetical protein